ncbi:hypothetical protein [Pseudomonas aeruginosa]|uniref:hypothetical protein n=1 Tax=Pseudomonas aeruginosa TaxID=287 RepID=UPI0021592A46|nr:hypothetical protein [Pseudomonas aeruginosa]
MTAVDLLLVATLLAALLAWWIPALPGRRGLLALASTLALGAGLYAVWDDRWQAGVGAFAGFSLLLGACLRRKPVRGLPFRTGSLYGLLVLLAIAALYLFPVAPLPAPSGPYAVGVRDFELDDPSRPGLLGAPAGQPRRLLVRAWYPARPIAGAAPRHYFDPDEARSTARASVKYSAFRRCSPTSSTCAPIPIRTPRYATTPLACRWCSTATATAPSPAATGP